MPESRSTEKPDLWYYESDGGRTWVGHYWSHQPVTHYLIRRTPDRIFREDMPSKRIALKTRDAWNKEILDAQDYAAGVLHT